MSADPSSEDATCHHRPSMHVESPDRSWCLACGADRPRAADEVEPSAPDAVQTAIARECDAIKAMLLAKNAAYGNSALDPVRVFSRASSEEAIRVRLDDKLSRLARGKGVETEDVEADIIGYLILLRVHRAGVGK